MHLYHSSYAVLAFYILPCRQKCYSWVPRIRANRNLHLRVADPRLSENITDVDKELMVDAIRQLKIKRFVRQHEGTSWNHCLNIILHLPREHN